MHVAPSQGHKLADTQTREHCDVDHRGIRLRDYAEQNAELLRPKIRFRELASFGAGQAQALHRIRYQESILYLKASHYSDSASRETIARHAIRSESDSRIKAMLERAKAEAGVAIEPARFDADPFLLNVTNGTLDLKTGELHPHQRTDLITKFCPVAYDPDARSELFEKFLADITNNNDELIQFLQRAAGYSLIGGNPEEKLFLVHGPGATGKSTFLEAVKAMLGNYAVTADFETFLRRREASGPRNDVARLAGARLIVSIEVEQGKSLAEGLVKILTGGDTVAARFLHREHFEFQVIGKLWLCANDAPRVSADDSAIWRRIVRLPFESVIPAEKREPKIKATLTNTAVSGAAILAWAVNGCLEWQRRGLAIPDLIELATREYQREQDPLRDFLVEVCVLEPNATETLQKLWMEYQNWQQQSGEIVVTQKAFKSLLRFHGCKPDRTSRARFWKGIRLSNDGM